MAQMTAQFYSTLSFSICNLNSLLYASKVTFDFELWLAKANTVYHIQMKRLQTAIKGSFFLHASLRLTLAHFQFFKP